MVHPSVLLSDFVGRFIPVAKFVGTLPASFYPFLIALMPRCAMVVLSPSLPIGKKRWELMRLYEKAPFQVEFNGFWYLTSMCQVLHPEMPPYFGQP